MTKISAPNSDFSDRPTAAKKRDRSSTSTLFIVLGILQALGVGIILSLVLWAIYHGEKATVPLGYFFLYLHTNLIPFLAILAFINLVGLPIYLIRRKPRVRGWVLSALSLIVSAVIASYSVYLLYNLLVVLPKESQEHVARLERAAEERDRQFAADNVKPEITKEEAIAILKTCQLNYFYYTKQTDRENGQWGELSSTGVVLIKREGQPYTLSIAKKHEAQLVPIAREAQQTCGDGPVFWYDGDYESQRQDGTWFRRIPEQPDSSHWVR